MKWTRHEVGCHTHVPKTICYICKSSLRISSYWQGKEGECNTEFTVCLYCYRDNGTPMSIDAIVRRQYETEKAVGPPLGGYDFSKVGKKAEVGGKRIEFMVPEEKVRFYMWKQRLKHWVQLLVCLALLGGTGLGVQRIGGCISVMAEREKTEYQISGKCDNCKRSVSIWLKDGTPMGEGVCPKCKVSFGEWG